MGVVVVVGILKARYFAEADLCIVLSSGDVEMIVSLVDAIATFHSRPNNIILTESLLRPLKDTIILPNLSRMVILVVRLLGLFFLSDAAHGMSSADGHYGSLAGEWGREGSIDFFRERVHVGPFKFVARLFRNER
jgi:hypothetical protein